MRQRLEINHKEFYQRFYSDSGVPEEIPLRLRGVYASNLVSAGYFPRTGRRTSTEELDFGDLLFAVAAEISIGFSESRGKRVGGRGDI